MSPAKYHCLIFDVGGTLIHPKPSVGAVYAREARQFGVEIDASQAQKSFIDAWKSVKRSWKKPLRYGQTLEEAMEFWRDVVYRTFAGETTDGDMEKLFIHLFSHFARPEVWVTYDFVRETLSELKNRGYTLGILSNWDFRLVPILKGMGLSEYFQHIFISFAMGLEKPDLAAIQHCLNVIGIPVKHVLYIGNDYDEDYIPAQKLGLDCYLLQSGDHSDSQHSAPKISSIKELLHLI